MRRIGMFTAALGLALLLGGCSTRSISDSGYHGDDSYGYAYRGGGSPFYKGELSEFDVLGIDVARPASDEEIAQQLEKRQKVAVRKGGVMMVMQSGAVIPDDDMVKALGQHFSVVPFAGVPLVRPEQAGTYTVASNTSPKVTDERITNYARALRLAAAKSGADVIFCYWGMLESASEREATAVVSWVPIIGSSVPDQTQVMRIRLKVAVIDVRSGQWSMFAPDAYIDTAFSAERNRAASDQRQVQLLKAQAYKAAVEAFIARYAG
jgi:hypothetical protein